MKKVFTLIAFLSALNLTTFSQADFRSGFILITKNDTIFGQIDYNNDKTNSHICIFRKSETEEVREYSPLKIYGFKFDHSKYYVSKTVVTNERTEKLFFEFLVEGEVNLYCLQDNSKQRFFLESIDKPLTQISYDEAFIYHGNKQYARSSMLNNGLISYFLVDCPEIHSDILNVKQLSQKQLINLLKKYHDLKCPNSVCLIHKKSMPKIRIDFQPVVGLTNVHNYFSAYAYDKSGYRTQLGVLAYLWLPLTNEKLFFKTGVIYSKVSEATYWEFLKKTTTNHHYYKIPLQFQYIFLKHRVYPTFGMGVNVVVSKGKPAMFLPVANLGATISVTKKLYLSLCAEADYFSPYFIIPSPNSTLASNSFTVGFTWKM